ncbi:MAG: DUF1580 domain-containing protein [Planctomycetes bacterium]|nr:DUF1580 domain-containing protein [Planctomycetota bacterium]
MEPLNPRCQRLRPLAEYAARLPSGRPGKRLNRSTLWRWALSGVRGGRRLKTAALGRTRVTCDAWVWEFLEGGSPGRELRLVDSGADPVERERIARRLGAS